MVTSKNPLLREKRISLVWLANRLDVDHSTVYRWITIGVRGYKLESFSIGGRRYTTQEAYSRWFEKTNYEWTGGRTAKPR